MKSREAKYKTIMTATVSLCLSFAVLMLALYAGFSLAWFANNTDVTATGMGVSIAQDNGANIDSFQIYKRYGSTAKQIASSDDVTPVAVQMTEFDPVFADRNVNTPVVVRLVVEDIPQNATAIVINASLLTNDGNNNLYDDSDKISTNLSNVIGARCAQMPTPAAGSSTPDLNTIVPDKDNDEIAETIYSTVVDALKETTPSVFLTIKNSTLTKEAQLEIVVSDFTPSNDRSVVLYLEIDYVSSLVSAFIDSHGIEITAGTDAEGDMIPFTYDLSPFSVHYSFEE